MGRQLAITRKFSLADVAEGWTKESYVLYEPLSYIDRKQLAALQEDGMTEEKAVDFTLNFMKNHIVSGKIPVLDESGASVISDLEKDDLDHLPIDTVNEMFSELTGAKLDPKAIETAAPDNAQPLSSEVTTATT